MLNFGKVSVTKGLGEWIALHKRMAPKMSEVGMFFRFVAADPNEETLFLVIEMTGDVGQILESTNSPEALKMREASGVRVETQEIISALQEHKVWNREATSTSQKIAGEIEIPDDFDLEDSASYLNLSNKELLVWSGISLEADKLYFIAECEDVNMSGCEAISEIHALYYP